MEEWKNAMDTYEVSNKGNVRRKLLNSGYNTIKCSILNGGGGYKYFQQRRDGKRYNYLIHHLVAMLFIGERPKGFVIDHIDRNSLNNCVENLRYTTQSINMQNTDKFRADIPLDTPNRNSVISKSNRDKNPHYAERKKEKLLCDKCNKLFCRAYLTQHSRKCDGTGKGEKRGRKFGDKSCILNLQRGIR